MISSGSHCVATLILQVLGLEGWAWGFWANRAGHGLERELVTRPWLGESTLVEESATGATEAKGEGGLGRARVLFPSFSRTALGLATQLFPNGPVSLGFSLRDFLQGGMQSPQVCGETPPLKEVEVTMAAPFSRTVVRGSSDGFLEDDTSLSSGDGVVSRGKASISSSKS